MNDKAGKKVILAVDDVSLNLSIIKNILSRDFDVRIAKSGEMALFIMGSVPVDLILMDIEMPKMTGFEFVESMKGIPEAKNIPVIFITSNANLVTIHQAYHAGVKDYLIKPIDAEILREKVNKVLNIK